MGRRLNALQIKFSCAKGQTHNNVVTFEFAGQREVLVQYACLGPSVTLGQSDVSQSGQGRNRRLITQAAGHETYDTRRACTTNGREASKNRRRRKATVIVFTTPVVTVLVVLVGVWRLAGAVTVLKSCCLALAGRACGHYTPLPHS